MPVTRVSGLPLPSPPPVPPFFLTSVSSSGPFLVDQYNQPFLVNGDSGWGAAWNLNSTDQTTYLSTRASQGFNTILTDLVGSTVIGGPSSGANWNGELPFTGGNFATPNNTYWARIDTFLGLCKTNGLSVLACPIDAYAVQSGQVFASMSNAQATTFGAFLGNRYPQSSYPGIVWMFGNDWDADGPSGSQQNATPSAAFYSALLSGIQSAGDSRITIAQLGYYESLCSDGTSFGPSMSINAAYSYHPTYEVILRGRAAGSKPVMFIEGAYENNINSPPQPSAPLDLRKQVLWTYTSGGTGTLYGDVPVWDFASGWQTNLSTTGVTQRTALQPILTSYNWWKLNPDTSSVLVTAGRQTQWASGPSSASATPVTNDATFGNYVTASFSSDGKIAAIYNPTSATLTLSSAHLAANPQIFRYDPTSGAKTTLAFTTSLVSPGNNAGGDPDWLYIITAG